MAFNEIILSSKTPFDNTIPTRRRLLDVATGYFIHGGWNLLPTSEGLILCYEGDSDLYYDFDSLGSLWRWWWSVYRARRQFLVVVEQAAIQAREGDAPSVALTEWLALRNSPCPPMMIKAYHGIWPHRMRRGWLSHALVLENIWTPGVDPLDIALYLTRKFEYETH